MSTIRYPEYKPSGVTWIGGVPSHWSLEKVKQFAQFSGGGTPSRENMAYWNGELPWVSSKDMKFETIRGAEESITPEGLANSSSNEVPVGSLLMVVRSGILKHTIPVGITDTPVAVNQDLKVFSFDESRCLAPFFLRWVQGLNDQLLLAWSKQGATVESLEHEYLANTVVPLPDVEEQISIITFLDREIAKIDALIDEQRRLITLLDEKRQAVISHAVTKGLNPDAPRQPSGIEWLGDIPAHWSVEPLKYSISKIGQGWSPQCDSEPAPEGEWGVLKLGCVSGNAFDPSEQKALPSELTAPPEYEVRAGDVLVSRGNTRELVGMSTYVPEVRPRLLLSDLLYRFQAKSTRAAGEFLAIALRSASSRFQIEREAEGTSHSMKKIGQNDLRNLRLGVPPLEEQHVIVGRLRDLTASLDILMQEAQRAIALLLERRAALITAAVTGQIDVRALAPTEAS